jgi:hypothetical protein
VSQLPSVTAEAAPDTWRATVEQVLVGHTCLWQDLDGLHVEPAPLEPPPTSILWAWSPAGQMVRVRLDDELAYVAVCPANVPTTAVETWARNDGRVRAFRAAANSTSGLELTLEQYVDDGIDSGTGPITFLRCPDQLTIVIGVSDQAD